MNEMDQQVNEAIDLLRSQGFVVEKPNLDDWITPMDLWREIGQRLCYNGFHRRLSKFPGDYPKKHGLTGRLIELRPTPELKKWLSKSKQQGAKML